MRDWLRLDASAPNAYAEAVRIVRVYDPTRQPRDWAELIQPQEYVVFASQIEGGVPSDFEGQPTSHARAVCGLAASLAEAQRVGDELVACHPTLRLDVFDAHGRSRPPLLTVVHPSRRRQLEGDPGTRRRQRAIAAGLIALAPVLFWLDWHVGLLGLPTLAGLNALVFAGRLLQLAAAYATAERGRAERIAEQPGSH